MGVIHKSASLSVIVTHSNDLLMFLDMYTPVLAFAINSTGPIKVHMVFRKSAESLMSRETTCPNSIITVPQQYYYSMVNNGIRQ